MVEPGPGRFEIFYHKKTFLERVKQSLLMKEMQIRRLFYVSEVSQTIPLGLT